MLSLIPILLLLLDLIDLLWYFLVRRYDLRKTYQSSASHPTLNDDLNDYLIHPYEADNIHNQE